MSERVLVVGAGTMGAGIAQVCAQSGREVVLADVDAKRLSAAVGAARRSLAKLAEKGRLAEPPGEVAARISIAPVPAGEPLPDCGADVAIEAVFEDLELKRGVLRAAEEACRPGALLATNTSGIPIGRLADALSVPSRLVGMHFFNPAALMRVVEVVACAATAPEAFEAAADFVTSLGKDPLRVRRDVPGFVLNRIGQAASNEAIRLVQHGVASAEEIDRGVKGAFGWKMGPFETADLVGLDVLLAVRTEMYAQTGDPRFEPPRLVRELVEQGRLGRKSGRGFFEYGEE